MSQSIPNLGSAYQTYLESRMVSGDFALIDATSLVAGTEINLGSHTVPAGLMIRVGNGYAYVVPQTSAPARIEGMVRIYIQNATGSTKKKILEFHTSVCTDEADKNKKQWVDPVKYLAKRDSKIIVGFTADATATEAQAKTVITLPCIKYDVA